MRKKSSVTKDQKLSIHYLGSLHPLPIFSLPLLSVTKSPGGALRYFVPIYSTYYSCVYSLLPSQEFSYEAYMRSNACVREMLGLFVGGEACTHSIIDQNMRRPERLWRYTQ